MNFGIKSLTALSAVAFLAIGGLASAQPETGARGPGVTALTTSAEATLARRLLMNSIGSNNDALHDMLDGVLPWDDFVFQSRLLSMYAMFEAFPHLYRVEPNPWTAERESADPAHVSLALPAVWEDWATFIALNEAAAQSALKAAFVDRATAKPIVDGLEMQCEECHDDFRLSFADFRDFEDLPPVDQPDAGAAN